MIENHSKYGNEYLIIWKENSNAYDEESSEKNEKVIH